VVRYTRRTGIITVAVLAGALLGACGSQASAGSRPPASSAPATAGASDDATSSDTAAPMPPGSSYVDYAVYRTKPAAYAGRRVALFFWASWCPICQGDDSYIRGTIASGDFPKDLTIVRTNYDVETGLEQKYGVTSQATFVLVDPSGKALSRPTMPETVLDILTLGT
jgi:thioredoxin 1